MTAMTAENQAPARADQPSEQTKRTPSASPPTHSNPIVAALHEMASTVLSEQLREMFEKADDVLFDSAEKARNGSTDASVWPA